MPAQANHAASDNDRTLVITRTLDAPRAAVFKAWTDPAEVARWMGPRGVTAEVTRLEPRVGGTYRIVMHGVPGGGLHVVGGVYREIVPNERLVFTWTWEQDALTHTAGHETTVTITLRAQGAKTELTLRHENFATLESRDSHGQGWGGSFDRMAELLATATGRT